jgi:hypothetical protein
VASSRASSPCCYLKNLDRCGVPVPEVDLHIAMCSLTSASTGAQDTARGLNLSSGIDNGRILHRL